MTQDEWLASDDPGAMLTHLRRHGVPDPSGPTDSWRVTVSDRKLRLFACAAWRHMRAADYAYLGFNSPDFRYVEAAEDLADGVPLPERFVGSPWFCFHDRGEESAERAVKLYFKHATTHAAILRDIVGNPWRPAAYRRETRKEGVVLVEVRGGVWPDGKPYTETQGAPWLTPTVLALAEAAYAARPGRQCGECVSAHMDGVAPRRKNCRACNGTGRIDDGSLDHDRLAVLADALEESGCADPDIIGHLRGPGPHVRGCAILDLILGKA